ncbi:MAG: hypothetical protein NTU83_14545 [Candidatus Hydrogenedentes bacterium]|nr:hypothetical protein [Candidatus Hydrogenedentota bacterium]
MTNEPSTIAASQAAFDALNRVFMDRYHSMAAYILEASPYVGPEDQQALQRIQAVAAFDRTESERLASVIESLGAVPHVGPYSRRLAELNYLSVHHLRRYLADQLLAQVADYTALLPSVQECPEVRDAIVSLIGNLKEFATTLSA